MSLCDEVTKVSSFNKVEKMTKKEYKAEWQRKNKEKMAEYAKKYYYKRCESDPEYKQKLCDKVKSKYISKKKFKLNKVSDDDILEIVELMEEPFIFPDPTGLDLNMNTL